MTAPDDIPTPPAMPHRWLEGVYVRHRSGVPSGTWRVVSQEGGRVELERGRAVRVADWSELVEERHAEAARAENGRMLARFAQPLPKPAVLEAEGGE